MVALPRLYSSLQPKAVRRVPVVLSLASGEKDCQREDPLNVSQIVFNVLNFIFTSHLRWWLQLVDSTKL